LGVIGRNGAGKSTLLKILSRIVEPTSGQITLKGRVASLLEVGTGFNQELTGRENIYLNGSILGMTKKEIKKKFDEIVEFSGVNKFLDTPVKHYSSGMYVRLAFAVAAHLESEILLVDEVLAVGDAEFQKKCLGKMDSLAKSGRTVIFVSHNIKVIKEICKKSILLDCGFIKDFEDTSKIVSQYDNNPKQKRKKIVFKPTKLSAQISSISILNKFLQDKTLDINTSIKFSINLLFRKPGIKAYCGFNIYNEKNDRVIFWRDIELTSKLNKHRKVGVYKYILSIPSHTLAPGKYHLETALADQVLGEMIHFPSKLIFFEVSDNYSLRKKHKLPWRGLTAIPMQLEFRHTNASS
jgi:lipopolysaccharide transport system ATP-binding protein